VEPSVASKDGEKPRRRLIESVWVRAALAVAVAEGALVVAGVVPRWTAVLVAGVILAGYFVRGRHVTSPQLRQGLWAVALSQAVVLFVPIVLWIIGAVVIVALAAVAAVLLVLLIMDR
jgi:hypothetical protein